MMMRKKALGFNAWKPQHLRGSGTGFEAEIMPPPPDAPAPNAGMPDASARPAGGFLGRPSGRAMGIFRRNDGDPGTFWNYLMAGYGGVEEMRNARMRRDMFGMQARGQKLEQAQAERGMQLAQERERLVEEYFSTLPADAQAQARMAYAVDPEAFAEALAQQMTGGGWQVGQGYSHAFRARPDGSIEMGGALPLRPRATTPGYDDATGDEWEAF